MGNILMKYCCETSPESLTIYAPNEAFLEEFHEPDIFDDKLKIFTDFEKVQIYIFKKNEKFSLLKTVMEGPVQYQNDVYQGWLERYQRLSHPNLMMLHYFFIEEYINMIFKYLRLTLYFDCPTTPLAHHYGIITEQGLDQLEIWTVLEGVVAGLAFLEQNDTFSGNISLDNIYQVYDRNGKYTYKVIEGIFKHKDKTNYMNFFEKFGNFGELNNFANTHYLSPKQLRALGQRDYYPTHNVFKTDVFALGVLLLYCINLQDVNTLYDFEQYEIREEVLESRLDGLREMGIERELRDTLKQMLKIEEEERPSFVQLDQELQKYASIFKVLRWKDQYHEYQTPKQKFQERKFLGSQILQQTKSKYVAPEIFQETKIIETVQKPQISNIQVTQVQRISQYEKGTLYYSNGCKYVGEYYCGKRCGKGIFLDKLGRILVDGSFENDLVEGPAKLFNYVNKAKDQVSYGHFDIAHPGNIWISYEGVVAKGWKQDFGVLKFINGDTFSGIFNEDKAHGIGEYLYADGRIIKGKWSNNRFIEYLN